MGEADCTETQQSQYEAILRLEPKLYLQYNLIG